MHASMLASTTTVSNVHTCTLMGGGEGALCSDDDSKHQITKLIGWIKEEEDKLAALGHEKLFCADDSLHSEHDAVILIIVQLHAHLCALLCS